MNTLEKIQKVGVVPVVALKDAALSVSLAKALTDGGMPLAEITFRTDCAEQVIADMKRNFPDMLVGAGTVNDKETALKALKAGADFIVSPGLSGGIAQLCREKGIAYIPGCVTPTEIMQALEYGIDTVKFFPAEAEGGLKTIKALAAPFGRVSFMPTCGINAANLAEYLSFAPVIACGGSWMVENALLEKRDFDEVTARCKKAVEIARNVKK